MTSQTSSRRLTLATGFARFLGAALIGFGSAAHAVSISDLPLFLSTGATSNVMLLVDNSGSMRNLITDAGYDPTVSYPDWSRFCGNNNNDPCWEAEDGNISLSQLPHCSGYNFNSDVVGGIRNGVVRCVRLPDPYGSNLTRVSGNYFNYLLENFGQNNAVVDIRNLIPDTYRMEVARNVATNIVNANPNLRIGLSSFNSPSGSNGGPGGSIRAACGSTTSTLTTAISNLDADSNTPLAETYYEITRYFRGLGREFGTGSGNYTSPITLRCQKSFVIAITDGFPTWDNNIPGDTGPNGTLPDYDGLDPETHQNTYPVFPQFSDGFKNYDGGSQASEGYTLYLDDLAKYGFEVDLRPSGTDSAGVSFNDPEYEVQNLVTYTVGFTLSNQMLQDAADNGDGTLYTADNESELNQALQEAFRDIHARTSSASSVATNTAQLSSDSFVYQARFSGGDWSGQLIAFEINNDGTIGTESWDAADEIPAHATRSIYTINPTNGNGVEFQWAQLTTAQQDALHTNAGGTNDNLGQQRLNYIRGDDSNEAPSGSFRPRSTVLGDIVNSDPVFVGAQDFGFDSLPGSEGSSYDSFLQSKGSRTSMIYVGANDGMLHGFNATTGVEQLAYVPNAVFPKLSLLTDTDYNNNHKYLVDGSPRVVDAYTNSSWSTVLVGALGAGGKGVFALDITDPQNFGGSDVLWEFTDSQDADMGVAIPQPSIARLNNGDWAAVVANGYNSSNGNAVLFLLDLEDGSVIKKFDTGVGSDNGLSSPIPVDVDSDRITDFIYAGDLKGNLWKFDVTNSNKNQWDVAFKQGGAPQPLFTACETQSTSCTSGNRQPITARPEVGLNPAGGFIVYFGTGRYFASGDGSVTSPTNSYYGIFDPNDLGETNPQPVGTGRSELLEQEVLATATVGSGDDAEQVRITSDHETTSSHKGWYIDLPESGERQVSTPILRGGRIIFTTLTPNSDPCGFGGTSWLMELDALTGSRLDEAAFDLNDDKEFDSDDFVTYDGDEVPVSGRRSKEGIIKTPGIITDGEIEYKYASGSTAGIDITVENATSAVGRQSWRQLQ